MDAPKVSSAPTLTPRMGTDPAAAGAGGPRPVEQRDVVEVERGVVNLEAGAGQSEPIPAERDGSLVGDFDSAGAEVVVRRVELAGGQHGVVGGVLPFGQLADLGGADVNGQVAFGDPAEQDGVEDQGLVGR